MLINKDIETKIKFEVLYYIILYDYIANFKHILTFKSLNFVKSLRFNKAAYD